MPDEKKTLKFEFVVDQNSAQRARQIIREITQDVEKLVTATNRASIGNLFGGGMGGGGIPGMSGGGGLTSASMGGGSSRGPITSGNTRQINPIGNLTSILQKNRSIFRDLSNISKETLSVMSNSVSQATNKQIADIERLKKAVDQLTNAYGKLKSGSKAVLPSGVLSTANAAAFKSSPQKAIEAQILQNIAQIQKGQGNLGDLQGMGDQLGAAMGGGTPPGQGFGPRWWRNMSGPQKLMFTGAAASSLGKGISAAGDIGQAMKEMYLQNRGTANAPVSGLLHRMMGGDFRDLFYMNYRYNPNPIAAGSDALSNWERSKLGIKARTHPNVTGGEMLQQTSGLLTHKLSLMGGGVSAVGSMASSAAALGVAGGAGGGAGSGGMVFDASQGAGAAGNMFGGASKIAYNSAESLQGGPRAKEAQATQRTFQMMRSNAPPFMNAGFDFLDSTAVMQVGASKILQGKFRGAWGIGGAYGLTIGQSVGLARGIQSQFGTGGLYNTMRGALSLEQQGFSQQGAAQILGTMATGYNTSRTEAPVKAKKDLEGIFARGLAKGIKDARLYEGIAKAVSETARGFGGRTGMGATGAFLMAGLNKNSQMADVSEAIRGMQGFNRVTQKNPYYNTALMEVAKNVLGDKASGVALGALGKSSLSDLLNGNEMLNSMGISSGERKSILGRYFNFMMKSNFVNPNSDIGKRLAQGQTLNQIISGKGGHKRMQEIAATLSVQTGMGNMREMEKLIEGFAHMNDKEHYKGRDLPGHGNAVAQRTIEHQQKVLEKLYEQLNGTLGPEIKARHDYLDSLSKIGESLKAMEDTYKHGTTLETGHYAIVKVIKIMTQPTPTGTGHGGPH